MSVYVRDLARPVEIVVLINRRASKIIVPPGTRAEDLQCASGHLKWLANEYLKAERHAQLDVMIDGDPLGPEASMRWVRDGRVH